MIYTGYTKTDSYYEFVGENNEKLLAPTTDIVLVDDESGMISIKNTASRCTVGLLKQGSTPPTPPTFQGKWLATYTGGTTSSAECDSTSAITMEEVTNDGLASLEVGQCVTTIGESAFDSTGYNLTSVTLSDSVTTIDNNAFDSALGLSVISLGNGITSIGQMAFDTCESLSAITIPSTIMSIGAYAFEGCTSLATVTILATTPPTLGEFVFDREAEVIYVPATSVDAYKSATGWSRYASRIQAIQ